MNQLTNTPGLLRSGEIYPKVKRLGPSAKERLEKYNVSPKIDRKSQKQVLDSFVDTLSDIVLDTKLSNHTIKDVLGQLKSKSKRIRISVCGHVFVTRERTLEQYPKTRLYEMLKDKSRADDYNEDTEIYYFDRHLPSFSAILYFYQYKLLNHPDVSEKDGILMSHIWRPLDVPMEIFVEEVIFFELDDLILEQEEFINGKPKSQTCCKPATRTYCIAARETVWKTFEEPETGVLAKVINVSSIFFIVLSTISFCLETMPDFHKDNCYNRTINGVTRSYERQDYDPLSKTFGFWIIETLCIMFFTIEYCLRFWASVDRFIFFRGLMNLIDLSAIAPYYVVLIFQMTITDDSIGLCESAPTLGPVVCEPVTCQVVTCDALPLVSGNGTTLEPGMEIGSSNADKATFLMVLRVIRLARIVRIAKLSKHSRNLATLIKTMEKSLRELSFLMLFFIVSMILFSTFVYFCEVAENSAMFPSIPSSFWWAIVTMTTVGYGDTYPISPLGKVVGFFCAICGVLCIALPVPSIVSNFHRIYQEDQIMNPHGNFHYKDDNEEKRCKLRKKFLNDV